MNIFKNICLTALLGVCSTAALTAQESVLLNARIQGLKKGESVYIIKRHGNEAITDTLTCSRNGRINATIDVPYTCEGLLFYLPAGKTRRDLRSSDYLSLCLDPASRLTLRGKIDDVPHLKITGGLYDQHRYRSYFDTQARILAQAGFYSDSLSTLNQTAQNTPEGPERDSLIRQIKTLNEQTWAIVGQSYQEMENFIRRYPDDPFSAYVLTSIRGSQAKHRRELFDLLSEQARNTPNGQLIATILTTEQAWQQAKSALKAGSPAPDFSLTGIDGQKVTLSDFRGKYVLLDFWGSWCGPCRKANKQMVELFEKYGRRNDVAFISLALDRDDKAWRKAVREDGLSWTQVNMCEQPDGPTSVNVRYGINLYPTQILLSPEGNILVLQPGDPPANSLIERKLAELFGK